MRDVSISAEGQHLIVLSQRYFAALLAEDDEAARTADRSFEAVAANILKQPVISISDAIDRAIIARHYQTDRPEPDEEHSALQNGAGAYVVVDAVLALAGLPRYEDLA